MSQAYGPDICRNGCAEMQCGGPYWLPPRRAPFGRRAGQPSKGAPTGTALSPRAGNAARPHLPLLGKECATPGPGKNRNTESCDPFHAGDIARWLVNRERSCGSWRRRRAVRSSGQTGTPRRVVRLPMADSLCDRMERGEEEAPDRRRVAFRRSHFCKPEGGPLPTSGRRKFPSGNFRSARDLEGAKRVSRGQAYRQPQPSPFARRPHRTSPPPQPLISPSLSRWSTRLVD